MPSEWGQVAITLAIAVLVIVRQLGERRVRVRGMWLIPIILAAVTGELIYFDGLFTPVLLALYALAVVVGGAIGWYQGTHIAIRVDRAAHAMFVKASPIGALIWAGVLIFRLAVRLYAGPNPTSATGELVSTVLLALAVGLVAGQRLYLQKAYFETPEPAA